MRVAIVVASVVAVALVAVGVSAWAREGVAPTCTALNTQRHATLYTSGYVRYCGPGRAVLRIEGTSFTIEGGSCSGRLNRRSFGLIGSGGLPGKGFWFRLAPVVAADGGQRWYVRPGRNTIMDGEVDLPGFSSLPHQGTATVSRDLRSATFSVGDPSRRRVTGSWTCR
jgi:hypothetical protein